LLPTPPPAASVNQRLWSGPTAMEIGSPPLPGSSNSETAPSVDSLAIRPASFSAIHRTPSGPAATPYGFAVDLGRVHSVSCPSAATLATAPSEISGTHRLPSGATVGNPGLPLRSHCSKAPVGDILPSWLESVSLIQSAPSRPRTMPVGPLPGS